MATVSAIPGYLTLAEVAKKLGKSHAQCSRYVKSKLLPSVPVGNQKLVRKEDAEAFTPPPRGNPLHRKRKR